MPELTQPTTVHHGGSCCGVIHLRSFDAIYDRPTEEELVTRIKSQIARYVTRSNNNRLCEVVLTDIQCQKWNGLFVKALRIVGFELVVRFRNSNSGNVCNVFHLIAKKEPLDNLPFEWGPPIIPEATFHRVVRGRVGVTAYPSVEAARSDAPKSLERVVKRVLGSPDENAWSIHPEVKNPFQIG